MAGTETESRKALRELIDLLGEVDERWLSPEWRIESPDDVVDGHRALMHILQGGLFGHFEDDPAHPVFQRIVSPTRKFTGDNPDAIYFEAAVEAGRAYRVRGNMDGAVYVSVTIEAGGADRRFGTHTAGAINDTEFDVGPDGSVERWGGGPERDRNWIGLTPDAWRITTRHYFEQQEVVAADPVRPVPVSIECLDAAPAPPRPDDASVAAGIRRAASFVRSRTLEMPPMAEADQPPFVSRIPNQFPAPVKPGNFALAAFDAAYSHAPYLIGPDDALVVTGRWPECRCAHVCLWTRFIQTYDYANRQIGLNRVQTQLEPDGSFRMVIAHRDPGVPNWLDTEGRLFGMVFWRFMLPEGEIETPQTQVVPFAEVARR